MRNSVSTCPNRVFLISEASMLNEPGPRIEPRRVSPYVPVGSVMATKHEVSNQRSIVGLSSLASQIWFGRLPVPVDATPCVWVTVNGRPPRRLRMPLICQPPYSLLRAHGSSYIQLDDSV